MPNIHAAATAEDRRRLRPDSFESVKPSIASFLKPAIRIRIIVRRHKVAGKEWDATDVRNGSQKPNRSIRTYVFCSTSESRHAMGVARKKPPGIHPACVNQVRLRVNESTP